MARGKRVEEILEPEALTFIDGDSIPEDERTDDEVAPMEDDDTTEPEADMPQYMVGVFVGSYEHVRLATAPDPFTAYEIVSELAREWADEKGMEDYMVRRGWERSAT